MKDIIRNHPPIVPRNQYGIIMLDQWARNFDVPPSNGATLRIGVDNGVIGVYWVGSDVANDGNTIDGNYDLHPDGRIYVATSLVDAVEEMYDMAQRFGGLDLHNFLGARA